MPRKTIYVSKEDHEVFKEYAEKIGGEEGIGKMVADVMRERLEQHQELEGLAFRLCLLIQAPNVTEFVRDLAQYRLDSLSDSIKNKGAKKALHVMAEDPTFFDLRIDEERKGFHDVLIRDDNEWFEEGEQLASRYRRKAANKLVAKLKPDKGKNQRRKAKSQENSAALDDEIVVVRDADEVP